MTGKIHLIMQFSLSLSFSFFSSEHYFTIFLFPVIIIILYSFRIILKIYLHFIIHHFHTLLFLKYIYTLSLLFNKYSFLGALLRT